MIYLRDIWPELDLQIQHLAPQLLAILRLAWFLLCPAVQHVCQAIDRLLELIRAPTRDESLMQGSDGAVTILFLRDMLLRETPCFKIDLDRTH